MKIRFLSPLELMRVDPTGLARAHCNSYPADGIRHKSPSQWFTKGEEAREFLTARNDALRRCTHRHDPYLDYNDAMRSKWGAQGGTAGWKLFKPILHHYYEFVPTTIPNAEVLDIGLSIMLDALRIKLNDVGYPQTINRTLRGTSAGLPTMGTKGLWHADTAEMEKWGHAWPAVPGQRLMRNSIRAIFMDSNINVRRLSPYLTGMREWLKQYFPQWFDAWRNPDLTMRRRFTRLVDCDAAFLSFDYEKMDQHFSLALVQRYIYPILEVLFPHSALFLASAVEELFNQSLFCGNYMIEGLHNLFSGQIFTNDFETLFDVMMYLGIVAVAGIDSRNTEVFALGDDVVISVTGARRQQYSEVLRELYMTTAEAVNLKMNAEKSTVSHGQVTFCRKTYYPAGPRDPEQVLLGAYPTILALNNLYQPERPADSPGLCAVADLQRCDGCLGSPDYEILMQLVAKCSTHKWRFTEEDVETYNSRSDWWMRLYGERYNPAVSPSFRWLIAHGKIT